MPLRRLAVSGLDEGDTRQHKGRENPASMQSVRMGGVAAFQVAPLTRYMAPVCCHRVAAASPATVLPLWKTAAFASGATAADKLRAAKAARIRFFIGILQPLVGRDVRLRWTRDGVSTGDQYAAVQHPDMRYLHENRQAMRLAL